jgi:hypothetical protein
MIFVIRLTTTKRLNEWTGLEMDLWVSAEDRQMITMAVAQGHEVNQVEMEFQAQNGCLITAIVSA